ncbi:uncharacterized protein LOC118270477 [Spodoptera frugiperda]|uniref:Uncharacterized protein LOC118270477 n=1 Tax=Spodoptera frugiperda TaxID=7108 RepID=A0A9R0EYI4_SPOFR|nr:uncharacterized protein LOC118270477 [Spodoptera frugiperda]
MLFVINLLVCITTIVSANPTGSFTPLPNINNTRLPTRRILRGRTVGDTRPYMVYLRPAAAADPKILETNWLCGGVIIHERYILTSAACIEDAKHFYVVSGLSTWYPFQEQNNECIENGAKKAVWKCVPKSYYFDGDDFDNIRWMVGDIAVVKVEDNFNFERRIRGCDFIPKKVDFNNRSADYEKARQVGTIAGWGTTERFGDEDFQQTYRTTINSPALLETDVQLVSKKNCKRRWEPRYHFIIDEHMICTRDSTEDDGMGTVCSDREVNCKELVYSEESSSSSDDDHQMKIKRRMMIEPSQLEVHTARHVVDTRRVHKITTGGFCENDHGGPLIIGQGKSSMVIGVMSACLTKDIVRKCYGPFLYTSVYRYRNLITCAIDKDLGPTCRRLLRSSKTPMIETTFDWSNHIDGPAKDDHSAHKVRSDDVDSGYKKSVTKTAAKAKPVATTTAADSSDT